MMKAIASNDDDRNVPQLSIVIATLDRRRLLQATVGQLLTQRFQDFELLVIDQSDTADRTANEAHVATLRDPRIRYVHLPIKGLPNARNEGLARASGRIVLFLDDDVILLNDDFLRAHLDAYEDPRVGGVSGRIVERLIRSNASRTTLHMTQGGRIITNLLGTERQSISMLKGANMSYRTEVFAQVGGFDRNYIGTAFLEDADLSARVAAAGWKLRFEPEAELLHLFAPSGGTRVENDALWNEYWRFRSSAYFMLKHKALAFPLFLATFGAIAVKRAGQWRSPAVVPWLVGGIRDGIMAWQNGPDQAISNTNLPSRPLARYPASISGAPMQQPRKRKR